MTTCCFVTSIDATSLRGLLNLDDGARSVITIDGKTTLRPIAFRAGYGIMSSFTTEMGEPCI